MRRYSIASIPGDGIGREVVPATDPFDPASYDAMLRIDLKRAEASFPEVFAKDAPQVDYGDWADAGEDD